MIMKKIFLFLFFIFFATSSAFAFDTDFYDVELDLDSLEKRIEQLRKKAKAGDKEAAVNVRVIEPIIEALKSGKPALTVAPDISDKEAYTSNVMYHTDKKRRTHF